jgi:hypothetical protein
MATATSSAKRLLNDSRHTITAQILRPNVFITLERAVSGDCSNVCRRRVRVSKR